MPGKTNNGRILYKVGLHWCYIDENVLYKNLGNEPVSLLEIEALGKA